ncbi:MAG: trypsin-like serine protease, partial [Proteobacteria bacterium]|nr:trypsin-like serine protease [Pseudomonadota bacterium]
FSQATLKMIMQLTPCFLLRKFRLRRIIPVLIPLICGLLSCGPKLPSSGFKIIGGTPSRHGEFTSVVAILRHQIPICSGVIVASKFVLSAAHCFEKFLARNPPDLTAIQIYEGLNGNALETGTIGEVHQITLHPQLWQSPRAANDLALIEMTGTLQGEVAGLVTDHDVITALVNQNKLITIVGFGMTKNTPSGSPNLTSSEIHGIKNHALAKIQGIRADELFVGDETSDTCSGDSGGPAFISGPLGEPLTLAITGRGPSPCAQKDEPGSMTLVKAGICWISKMVGDSVTWQDACRRELTDLDLSLTLGVQEVSRLKKLNTLDLSDRNIQKLTWIDNQFMVEELNLAWNRIADATPLLLLPKLRVLDIRGNNITDSSVLETLKKHGVKIIGEGRQIENYQQTEFLRISALGAAAGVEQRTTILALREILTPGTNLRRSADLATRVYLSLGKKSIRSLNPLMGLDSVESLILSDNPLITDLSPLLTLPRLKFLDITGTKAATSQGSDQILKTLAGQGVTIKRLADLP